MNGFLIGAEKSGSGKTTLTTGIVRALSESGKKVAPFKCGPDYIDTRHLSKAAGYPAENLDTVMLSVTTLAKVFAETCFSRDIAVIEGVMGFFDGIEAAAFTGSSHHVASCLGVPAVIVLDAASMSYTSAAVLKGMQALGGDIAGVIINNAASLNHENLIKDAIRRPGLSVFGCVPKQSEPLVKSRHLGIQTAMETDSEYYRKCAELVRNFIDLNALSKLEIKGKFTSSPENYTAPTKICAVALDAAFSFYYEANFRELRKRGYDLRFFSPLKGETIENADMVYLGGGYPELYIRDLKSAGAVLDWLREHSESGRPMLGECGGMMILTDGINVEEEFHRMAGVFSAECRMTARRQALGYVRVIDSPYLNGLVGHEFHYSVLENVHEPYFFNLEKITSKALSQDGFLKKRTLAGYVHFHFGSQPNVLDFLLS
jgi:cobyrinic acid a,c-diamide synthase